MSDKLLTVKRLGEIVDREIQKMSDGEISHQSLTAISKALNVMVKSNADAIRYANARGEKPSIPFYSEL